ncbi:hypothetical protein [Candidatus Solirubrobacter pratensis]|uniref:hypothetical protein n=1 Tax=Candidatus Solirubrobacter pratensis TaxID=1298857 RepID=UPI0012DE9C6E|nr:hypothetical protein [Candidatus Solirubrobacter pratensis]
MDRRAPERRLLRGVSRSQDASSSAQDQPLSHRRCRDQWPSATRRASRAAKHTERFAIGVDDQFTVFGAGGALLFTLLSGLLLARLTPVSARAA